MIAAYSHVELIATLKAGGLDRWLPAIQRRGSRLVLTFPAFIHPPGDLRLCQAEYRFPITSTCRLDGAHIASDTGNMCALPDMVVS